MDIKAKGPTPSCTWSAIAWVDLRLSAGAWVQPSDRETCGFRVPKSQLKVSQTQSRSHFEEPSFPPSSLNY